LNDKGEKRMLDSKELGKMGKAIEEIGATKTCITGQIILETKKIVLDKGLDAAEIYASQLTGSDENTELSRVLSICRKNKLSQQAIAQLLDNLKVMESGKW